MLAVLFSLAAATWLMTQLPLPRKADSAHAPAESSTLILGHNGIHVDFVFHRDAFFADAPEQLRSYAKLFPAQAWIAVGWGDANFLLWHPTWQSVGINDLWQAGFASEGSALRLSFSDQPWGNEHASLVLDKTQWTKLMQYFSETLGPAPRVLRLDERTREVILSSEHNYSLLYTCNDWVADILKAMDQKTPWVITTSSSIMRYY